MSGPPRRATREEARAAAWRRSFRQPSPPCAAHLGDGDPEACRAGLRVIELAYDPAPAPTTDDAALPDTLTDVRALGWRELQVVAARLLGELPSAERDITTMNVVPVVVTNGTVE